MNPPGSRPPHFKELLHGLDQLVLGQGFQQEGIGPRFTRPAGRRQDAEDQHRDAAREGIRLELAAQRQPVELGNEYLRDDDVGDELPGLRQGVVSVLFELDGVAGLVQEVRLELADVRITFDNEG